LRMCDNACVIVVFPTLPVTAMIGFSHA